MRVRVRVLVDGGKLRVILISGVFARVFVSECVPDSEYVKSTVRHY